MKQSSKKSDHQINHQKIQYDNLYIIVEQQKVILFYIDYLQYYYDLIYKYIMVIIFIQIDMILYYNAYYNVLFIVNLMNDFMVNIKNLDIIKLYVIYQLIIFIQLDNFHATFKFYVMIFLNFHYL